jgi:5-formyltetrahydrofolate cyclo-ligase
MADHKGKTLTSRQLIAAGKAQLRSQLIAARKAIPASQRAADEQAVCARLLTIIEGLDPTAGAIGLYRAIGSELRLDQLADALRVRGYRLAFPVWEAAEHNRAMEFHAEQGDIKQGGTEQGGTLVAVPLSDAEQGSIKQCGIEQDETLAATPLPPEQLALLVVPGLGFDAHGHRLGYGAGYYDRYLLRLAPGTSLWGAAFNEQLHDLLPTEGHDMPLTGVITPGHTA